MRADSSTKRFLDTKLTALKARGRRLTRLTPRRIGLRPEDLPYALSRAHFHAANKRLASIGDTINREILTIERNWPPATTQEALTQMAMLDRRVDRLRRTFGMFFEVMSQRGSGFAPALAAHDAIAMDCYTVVRNALPGVFAGPLLKPLTYLEHGYSPATQRRGLPCRDCSVIGTPFR